MCIRDSSIGALAGEELALINPLLSCSQCILFGQLALFVTCYTGGQIEVSFLLSRGFYGWRGGLAGVFWWVFHRTSPSSHGILRELVFFSLFRWFWWLELSESGRGRLKVLGSFCCGLVWRRPQLQWVPPWWACCWELELKCQSPLGALERHCNVGSSSRI